MSGGFGSAFGAALAAAGPAAGPALQAAGAAAADPHATAMALAVSAAQARAAQAAADGAAEAGPAAGIARDAAAGLRPASDAVAAAAALPSAAAVAPGAAAGLAAVGQQFSPATPVGAPGVACACPAADNPAVEIVWPPNRGFDGDPVPTDLAPGATLSRYGGWIDENGQFQDKGSFVAPHDVPYEMRALPAGTDLKPLSTYEVLKTIVQVPSGPAAPWFGQPGGGVQHDLPMSINKLLEGGYIRVIDRVIPG